MKDIRGLLLQMSSQFGLRSGLRRLAALALAALLVFAAVPASAAVDPAAAPNLSLAGPDDGVNSGASAELTVTTDLPGFLTVQLLDASKNTVATLCRNHELHTKENTVIFKAVDADGNPIEPGTYLLSGVAVSQFGVASLAVTVQLTVFPTPSVTDPEEPAYETEAPSEQVPETIEAPAPAETFETVEAPAPAETFETVEAPAPAETFETIEAPAPAPVADEQPGAPDPVQVVPETVSYAPGETTVGEEGLQIGVGVSDVAGQQDAGYWALTAGASDADIWAALTRDMVRVNVDEKESAYLYDSVGKGQKRLGTISGTSQGLNVVMAREDGWSLVEAYRNEDGAFVRGYIRSNRLTTVEPNKTYGLVIDKAAQTLTVYKDGERVGSCSVSTGLPTPDKLNRETPAGEFITVTRRGTTEMTGLGFCEYTIRINGNFHLCEMPSTKRKGDDFSPLALGAKGTRGNIAIAHDASADGGINAKWIWDMTDTNKRVKVLVFDDKARSDVPVGK